ncbi:MAG: hypothetical protein L6R40_008179 [Gallowayella cf. fulva]|nr:MAG: hypothetical protein L6R40_008179 [Xanthomendoza cf. fulva]
MQVAARNGVYDLHPTDAHDGNNLRHHLKAKDTGRTADSTDLRTRCSHTPNPLDPTSNDICQTTPKSSASNTPEDQASCLDDKRFNQDKKEFSIRRAGDDQVTTYPRRDIPRFPKAHLSEQAAPEVEHHRLLLIQRVVSSASSTAVLSQNQIQSTDLHSALSTTQPLSALPVTATPASTWANGALASSPMGRTQDPGYPHGLVLGLPPGDPTDPRGVPVAAVVGGVFGGILLTMITAFGIWMYAIRNNVLPPIPARRTTPVVEQNIWVKPELGDTFRAEIDGMAKDRPELETGNQEELEARSKAVEAEGDDGRRVELEGDLGVGELEGWVPRELEGGMGRPRSV